ncbi:type I-C CRISPR-associated protein Cas8c/Csd1 [Anaerosporobacter sp.]
MGWLNDLYLTYEENKQMIAENLDTDRATLLPIAHSTQNAQIEVTINEEGNYCKAIEIPKDNAVTIIPVTEDSGSRGNGNNPHPLEDKLEYIAGDYEYYTGKDNHEKYQSFIQGLQRWSESEYSTWQVEAVYTYLSKKTIMKDLIDVGIVAWKDGKLSDKKIEGIKQEEAFVRFVVRSTSVDQETESECVYQNKDLFDRYTEYYLSQLKDMDICYVTGKRVPCSIKHPAKIRYSGDKAKLISANDTSGFTYRGRLYDSTQVASIGYETSQKAHNALRWVISKQGFVLDNLSVAVWEFSGKEIIPIEKSTPEAFDDSFEFFENEASSEAIDFTNESYARKVRKASMGYSQNLDTKARVSVMGVEAATTGRLSIRFYHTYIGCDYINRLLYWHTTCFWRLTYMKAPMGKVFVGAPSLKDIAIATFGDKNNTLIKSTVERLIPCVIDKKDIPMDLVRAAVIRASNPNAFDSLWEYSKVLAIACAMVRKHHFEKGQKINKTIAINEKEEYSMALDKRNQDRSYLFGRLLGAAQEIETYALYVVNRDGEGGRRASAAERYMQRFQRDPLNTWGRINDAIRPYVARLESISVLNSDDEVMNKRGRIARNRLLSLQGIYDLFQPGDFEKKEPLTEVYLLGYNCQLNDYRSNQEE